MVPAAPESKSNPGASPALGTTCPRLTCLDVRSLVVPS
jgi:hypothetical protein